MQGPHIQIIVDRDPVPISLQTALNRLRARVSLRSIDKAADAGVSPTVDVCVILSRHDQPADLLEKVMARASESACATMILPSSPRDSRSAVDPSVLPLARPASNVPASRLASPDVRLEDALSADEITGRIKALCDIRRPLRRMRDELDRLKQTRMHPAGTARDLDDQLRLAAQVQNDLLPKPLMDSAPLTISTLYLPADYVSGDIYDITRLDEHRFGFSIADVTGHGLPAALLTLLIKKSLCGKDIFNHDYRIVEPDELLSRLNEDLLNARLSDCQFVTAMHAVFDRETSRIRWARGGSPYPILLRPGKTAQRLVSEGGLIGAFPQSFETAHYELQPGDVLVFYTDGVEALLIDRKDTDRASTGGILQSDWVHLIETDGPEAGLDFIRERATHSNHSEWAKDDITIIALQMN